MKLLLNVRHYLGYKFLNSLFFGLSTGSIFILYTPLNPSIYSLGGIFLAIGLLVVAKFYDRMMTHSVFYWVSLFVEGVVFLMVTYFLLFSYSYMTALCFYIVYQLTFMFGGYLVRIETLVLHRTALLSFADVAKQKGYLVGMVVAYLFYKGLEWQGISDKQEQVYDLHFVLLGIQMVVLYKVYQAFTS